MAHPRATFWLSITVVDITSQDRTTLFKKQRSLTARVCHSRSGAWEGLGGQAGGLASRTAHSHDCKSVPGVVTSSAMATNVQQQSIFYVWFLPFGWDKCPKEKSWMECCLTFYNPTSEIAQSHLLSGVSPELGTQTPCDGVWKGSR
jgi:hypothetical protein